MNNDFEPVLAGLQTYLQTKVGSSFALINRRATHWDDAKVQPCLQIRHVGVDDEWQAIYAKTALDVELWIYCKADTDPSLAADTTLNGLIKALRNAFAFDNPQGKFTIGGLVDWARIQGRSDKDDGSIDGQGKFYTQVKIVLP